MAVAKNNHCPFLVEGVEFVHFDNDRVRGKRRRGLGDLFLPYPVNDGLVVDAEQAGRPPKVVALQM